MFYRQHLSSSHFESICVPAHAFFRPGRQRPLTTKAKKCMSWNADGFKMAAAEVLPAKQRGVHRSVFLNYIAGCGRG